MEGFYFILFYLHSQTRLERCSHEDIHRVRAGGAKSEWGRAFAVVRSGYGANEPKTASINSFLHVRNPYSVLIGHSIDLEVR